MATATDSVATVLEDARVRLAAAGCLAPEDDAKAIAALVLGVDAQLLGRLATEALPRATAEQIRRLVGRRAAREPLEYIVGSCRFRGLKLTVDSRVLIPGATSELLVVLAHDLANSRRVHDVGSGCGAIALAIKHERRDLIVSGSDISESAVELARLNASQLGLDVAFSVAHGLPPGDYDLVVANLPSRDDAAAHTDYPPPELADHQPREAVFAGADDLAVIREVVSQTPPTVVLALEHTPRQTHRIQALMEDPVTLTDRHGEERVTYGHVRTERPEPAVDG